MSALKKLTCFFSIWCVLFCFSCTQQSSEQIIKEYTSADKAAEVCGISPVDFVPEEFAAAAYRTVYDCVFEAEYVSGEKTIVLRVVSEEFTTSNLSGFTDTVLSDVCTLSDGTVLEIESRENVLSCEWNGVFAKVPCDFSLVLLNGSVEEFKPLLVNAYEYFRDSEQ